MVITPWGDAAKLHSRKLRPTDGLPAAEVAANQRERLFAAMVAVVDEKGFEATSVADLIALSGVSRTTFYEHFSDKRDCFVAAVEAIVDATMELAAKRYAAADGSEGRARALLDTYVGLIVAQPAASRMCFIESYAAGPGALNSIWRAVEGFESLTREVTAETPGLQGMPAEMLSALIGAFYLIVHSRLYRGEEGELTELTPQLWEWALHYTPPHRALPSRRGKRTPASEREVHRRAPHDPAEEIIRALAGSVAEHSYPGTTIADIADRASISQSTFYVHFKGRKEVLLAALDFAGTQMMAAILPAARRGEDWPGAMRLAIGAMFSFAAAEPELTNLLAVGVYSAGPIALVRRDEMTAGLQSLFEPGYELSPNTAPIAAEAAVSVIYSLMYNRIVEDGPQSLPSIAPLATYICLVPFVGAEQAWTVLDVP
jgi:AcrR family transcriptional regulator